MRVGWKVFALLVQPFVLAAACSAGTGPAGLPGPDTSKGEIVIASELPATGTDGAGGRPAQQGAQFAVRQAQAVKGFKLSFLPFDDAVNGVHDPQKGAQNVAQMMADPRVLGMVGPFNSNVARAEIPIANQASLAMISPANIDECLTQALAHCSPKPASLRPTGKNNYFRVVAADTFQGRAMADFAVDTLKMVKVGVFSDNEVFGKNVADGFNAEFAKKGGSVVAHQDFVWTTTADFTPFLKAAQAAGAQGIFAGATSNTKGCLARAQMKGIFGPDAYYLGPDAIADSQCLAQAGDLATDRMYSSSGIPDATRSPDAAPVVDAYRKAFPKIDDVGTFTFTAYDCARVLIDAIGRAIDANAGRAPSRQQVLEAVATTRNLKLLGGIYSFDANGDPASPVLAIYQAKAPDWVFAKQFQLPAAP